MTAVIALANGKGGVKKSSMSRAIATEYTKAGWGFLGWIWISIRVFPGLGAT
jgi:chromosome partitioning protein